MKEIVVIVLILILFGFWSMLKAAESVDDDEYDNVDVKAKSE